MRNGKKGKATELSVQGHIKREYPWMRVWLKRLANNEVIWPDAPPVVWKDWGEEKVSDVQSDSLSTQRRVGHLDQLICSSCGVSSDPNLQFCGHCGAKLTKAEVSPVSQSLEGRIPIEYPFMRKLRKLHEAKYGKVLWPKERKRK